MAKKPRRLESIPVIERQYVPDEQAALRALRLVLGLPKLGLRQSEG